MLPSNKPFETDAYAALLRALLGAAQRQRWASVKTKSVLERILVILLAIAYSSTSAGAEAATTASLTLPQLADVVQKLVSVLAILGGGAWAYFRFFRFRTLKNRVEFSFAWKCSKAKDDGLVGILTVKLSNKGNTQVSLKKNGDFRCPLTYGLVAMSKATEPVTSLTLRPKDLRPLPFLFKAHRLVEPGETVDDVAILRLDVGDAVAIEFQAQVFSVRPSGRKDTLMSSVAAFILAPTSEASVVVSEDEQEEYDEVMEMRSLLLSWIAEAEAVVRREPEAQQSKEIEILIVETEEILKKLDPNKKPHPSLLIAATSCYERFISVVKPLVT